MKQGKSIKQFPFQYNLTGDELFLVNKHLDGNQYESKSVTLSTLVDYISERLDGNDRYLVTETENGIIYDIGVSGYEDDTMLNYRETI